MPEIKGEWVANVRSKTGIFIVIVGLEYDTMRESEEEQSIWDGV